jgi:hypothetical protein
MANWTNTSIAKCNRVIDYVDIPEGQEMAFASHRIGNVLRADLILTKDTEDKLAMLLTDLHKRGFFRLHKFLELIEEMKETPPAIDNINTPCPHEVLVKDRCINCGLSQEEIATNG